MASPLMMLLASLDNIKRNVGRNVQDAVQNPQDYAQKLLGLIQEAKAPQLTAQDMANMLPGGALGKIVYHGTPHIFAPVASNPLGKFLKSAIGTGEGNQSFGYGTYLAENKAVAKHYKDTLTKESTAQGDTVKFWLDRAGGNPEEAAKQYKEFMGYDGLKGNFKQEADSLLAEITKKKGSLYSVDLPDEHIAKMLDWDKPLAEQKHILDTLGIKEEMLPYISRIGGYGESAKSLINYMEASLATKRGGGGVGDADRALAADLLAQKGIPGIQYMDSSSRAAEEGTKNYVVFDPEILKILERE